MHARLVGVVLIGGATLAGVAHASPIAVAPTVGKPQVRLVDGSGNVQGMFFAYDAGEAGSVALADVDGDGGADFVAGDDAGGRADVVETSRTGTPLGSFLAASPSWGGGVQVAAGDLNGDGRPEAVTGAEGDVVARDVTGKELWSTDVGGDAPRVAVGGGLVAASGVPSTKVIVLDGSGKVVSSFSAGSAPNASVFLALGDVDGDGAPDVVVGADGTGLPQVQVFDARTGVRHAAFDAFDDDVTRVPVAVADVAGDSHLDVVAGTVVGDVAQLRGLDAHGHADGFTASVGYAYELALGGSGSEVAIAIGQSYGLRIALLGRDGNEAASVTPFPPVFGLDVALGDVDHDGNMDVLTSTGPGSPPVVRIFDRNGNLRKTLDAFDPVLRNGVAVATGDVNGDGFADVVVTPTSGDVATVRALDGRTGRELASFDAFPRGSYAAGRIAVGNVGSDPAGEIVVGAAWGAPEVKVFDGTGRLVTSFMAFDPQSSYGVDVAVGDVDGDGRDEIVAAFAGGSQIAVFRGGGAQVSSFTVGDMCCGLQVATADVNGDGSDEILVSNNTGAVEVFRPDGTRVAGFTPFPDTPAPLAVAVVPRVYRPVPKVTPPERPTVRGPRWTRLRAPRYRFHAVDVDGPASELRYRCAFDSLRLHTCGASYSQRLRRGWHRLRVQAIDGDGGRSPIARVTVLVAR